MARRLCCELHDELAQSLTPYLIAGLVHLVRFPIRRSPQ